MGSAELARQMGVTMRQAQRVLAGEASHERVVALAGQVSLGEPPVG
jgi:hypothetical protein